MKYFGTDGIRGRLKIELTDKLILNVAKAIVLFYNKHKIKRTLLIGNDSRASADYILSKLCSVLLKNGISVENVGVCSSPCLAYLTQQFNYPLGLMLSASHNPAEYNGLKFFNRLGEKVNDEFELEFEALMDKKTNLKNNEYTQLRNVEILKGNYISYLKTLIKFDFPIILDCANGGTSEICTKLFSKHEKINTKPNGFNINENAGCTHIEILSKLCIKKQKIGFAFDGDGDRVYAVDTNGEVINGDKILYILSKFYQKQGDKCIGTIYSNTALEKALKIRKINLVRADVGDKKVYRQMQEHKAILGGEDSGHIIVKKFFNTGDGILIAILIANIIALSKISLKELLKDYKEQCQLRQNIKLENLKTLDFLKDENLQNLIRTFEHKNARIIIRPSGTEPVLRLFVEHAHETTATNMLNSLTYEIVQLSSQLK